MQKLEEIIEKFKDKEDYKEIITDIKNANDFLDVETDKKNNLINDYQSKIKGHEATIEKQAEDVQDLKNRLFDQMVNTPAKPKKDKGESEFTLDNIKNFIEF